MSSVQTPLSLKDWQQSLQPMDLPVDPAIKTTAIQKLLSASGNAHNVAQILFEDPVLILRLVHTANKSLLRSGNELKSVAHAITLLGFPATERLLREAPEYDPQSVQSLQPFRQQLSLSLHAAIQLQGWSRHNPHWSEEGVFLATLLQRAPIWALWHRAPAQMLALQQLRQHGGGRHPSTEKRLLGCNIQLLATTLSRLWHLPTATQMSWLATERGNPRQWIVMSRIIPERARLALETFPELQRLATSSCLAIALANQLADEADWDWYSRQTLRLQRILATSLNVALGEAIAISHQQAVTSSRDFQLRHTMAPARQLLGFYQQQYDLPQPDPGQQALIAGRKAPDPTPAKVARGASAEFTALVERLRQQPQSFSNLHDLFNQAVQSLCRELEFERASASLLHPKTRELRTYYSSGCEDSAGLKNFRHPLKRGDLFNKLLQKPLSVHLNPENYSQIWPLLPGNFKQACGADQFVLMSIFAHKKPLALIYADRGISNRPLDDQQYSLFKQLCSAVSAGLSQLAG